MTKYEVELKIAEEYYNECVSLALYYDNADPIGIAASHEKIQKILDKWREYQKKIKSIDVVSQLMLEMQKKVDSLFNTEDE